jgi:hypothetical protein
MALELAIYFTTPSVIASGCTATYGATGTGTSK